MSHEPERDGCGVYIALLIIGIAIAIFVPFLWIAVGWAVLYLVIKAVKRS